MVRSAGGIFTEVLLVITTLRLTPLFSLYLVQWYKDGKFPINKIVQVYPVGELDKALEDLKAGKVRQT